MKKNELNPQGEIESIQQNILSAVDIAKNRIATDPVIAKLVEINGIDETTVLVTLSLPPDCEPSTSTATSLNAMALQVISKLYFTTEFDFEFVMSSCVMLPLRTLDSGKTVLPLEVTFSLLKK